MQLPDIARRKGETRRLNAILAALALTTAVCSVPLFAVLGFVPLLLPFVILIASCALVLPLDGHDRQAAARTLDLQRQRKAAAQKHAMRSPATGAVSKPRDQAAAFLQDRQAMDAAHTQGIHFASAHLPDEEFLRRFAAGELRAQDFRHGDHLRFAWLTLERLPFEMVEESVAGALRQFLRRIGGSNAQFHATHTRGWVRVLAALPQRSFAGALAANIAALHPSALDRYWSASLLGSDAARAHPVPADLQPLPAPAARRVRRYRAGNTSLPPAPQAPRLSS